jgi:periplasmic protein TonB
VSAVTGYGAITKKEVLRWSVCFAAMVMLHGGIAAALLLNKAEDDGDVLDTVVAVDVAFTTEAFKDTQVRDVPPGEEQIQTDVAPPPSEKAEQKPDTETPTPAVTTLENPDVALQAEPEKKEEKKEDEVEKTPNAAPPTVTASVTSAPTAAAIRSASVVSWRRKISLQVQRNMRYPPAAQAKREHGVTRVAFLINRLGHVVSSKILESSGSATLDQEALDLLHRTHMPKPPDDVTERELALSIPVRFDIK